MGKFLLATLSYAVITLALAYPWHMLWFHELYLSLGAYTRAEPSVTLGMTAMLLQGLIIAYLYPRFYSGGSALLSGIRFGLIYALIQYSVMGLAMAAKIDINPIPVYLGYSLLFQLIQGTLTGAAVGLIYARPRA